MDSHISRHYKLASNDPADDEIIQQVSDQIVTSGEAADMLEKWYEQQKEAASWFLGVRDLACKKTLGAF